jgi:hypothetical protein
MALVESIQELRHGDLAKVVEQGAHQLAGAPFQEVFAGLGNAIDAGLSGHGAAQEALIHQPVHHRHHRGVSEGTPGHQSVQDIAHGQAVCLPGHLHDRQFQLAQQFLQRRLGGVLAGAVVTFHRFVRYERRGAVKGRPRGRSEKAKGVAFA